MGNFELAIAVYLVVGILLGVAQLYLFDSSGARTTAFMHIVAFIVTALLWPVVVFYVRRRVLQLRRERREYEEMINAAIAQALREIGVTKEGEEELADELWRFLR